MPHYIITLSIFKQQIHTSVKNINKSLKLLLSQKKLKMTDYTNVIFIIKKLILCYHKFKGDVNHCLLSFYKTLFFSIENIKQSKQ